MRLAPERPLQPARYEWHIRVAAYLFTLRARVRTAHQGHDWRPHMRVIAGIFAILCSLSATASEPTQPSPERIKEIVTLVNDASNRMMMRGSSASDVEALFELYAEDFVYVHTAYGGEYSRDQLYSNSLKNLNAGRYKLETNRYTIVQVIPGLNAAAVERVETGSSKHHLSVFEFKDGKVSKITEYWK